MTEICVAVCTHDRPDDLDALLARLVPQVENLSASLVVVDNGKSAAKHVVARHGSPARITYVRLAESGLVAARNTALREALKGAPQFIAFIDDDEVPDAGWLRSLTDTLQTSKADICCGPLRPRFDGVAPGWAIEGRFFEKSGDHIGTGNMMFRTAVLPQSEAQWFQTGFAHIGGEDEELFARLIGQGARFATAREAWVTERVPSTRMTLSYILRTGLRDGVITVALAGSRRQSRLVVAGVAIRHVAAKLGYAAIHLVQALAGSWHLVAALRDGAEAAGTVAALFGWRIRHYGSNS